MIIDAEIARRERTLVRAIANLREQVKRSESDLAEVRELLGAPRACGKLGCDAEHSNLRCTKVAGHEGAGDAWSEEAETAWRAWREQVDALAGTEQPELDSPSFVPEALQLLAARDFVRVNAPTGSVVDGVPTFAVAWAGMERQGYQYGPDALEGVRLGWALRESYAVFLGARERLVDEAVSYLEHVADLAQSNGHTGSVVAAYRDAAGHVKGLRHHPWRPVDPFERRTHAAWLTVINYEGRVEALPWRTERGARGYFENASLQWSESWLCRVESGPRDMQGFEEGHTP